MNLSNYHGERQGSVVGLVFRKISYSIFIFVYISPRPIDQQINFLFYSPVPHRTSLVSIFSQKKSGEIHFSVSGTKKSSIKYVGFPKSESRARSGFFPTFLWFIVNCAASPTGPPRPDAEIQRTDLLPRPPIVDGGGGGSVT